MVQCGGGVAVKPGRWELSYLLAAEAFIQRCVVWMFSGSGGARLSEIAASAAVNAALHSPYRGRGEPGVIAVRVKDFLHR